MAIKTKVLFIFLLFFVSVFCFVLAFFLVLIAVLVNLYYYKISDHICLQSLYKYCCLAFFCFYCLFYLYVFVFFCFWFGLYNLYIYFTHATRLRVISPCVLVSLSLKVKAKKQQN